MTTPAHTRMDALRDHHRGPGWSGGGVSLVIDGILGDFYDTFPDTDAFAPHSYEDVELAVVALALDNYDCDGVPAAEHVVEWALEDLAEMPRCDACGNLAHTHDPRTIVDKITVYGETATYATCGECAP